MTTATFASSGTPARVRNTLRTAIVSSHYYPRYLDRSLRFARQLAQAVDATACVLVGGQPGVADALLAAASSFTQTAAVCRHDNVGLEFGAYQRGLDALGDWRAFDWLVIVNDAYPLHEPFPVHHLVDTTHRIEWHAAVTWPVAIGQVEGLDRSYAIEGLRTHRWITSNLVALNRAALEGLHGRLYRPELERLIVETDDPDRFFAAGVDAVLREHIARWLFDASAEFHWYRAAPLEAGNCALFARKARSILQEICLSARLDVLSTAFLDVKGLRRWQRLVLPVLQSRIRRRSAALHR